MSYLRSLNVAAVSNPRANLKLSGQWFCPTNARSLLLSFQIIVMYLKWLEQDANRELLQMSW